MRTLGSGRAAIPAAPPRVPRAGRRARARAVGCGLALVLLAASAALGAAPPGPPARAVDLPATAETPAGRYLIDLPPSGSDGAPLLLALHGDASSPEAMRALTGLTQAATAAGVAVAYPAAAGVLWNDGRGQVPGFAPLTPRDDVAFLEAVVRDAVGRFGVDAGRVTVVGLGSGGAMALELACRAPKLATALVVVNASLWDYQRSACAATGLPSLLLLHGDADPRHPWDGLDLSARGVNARELGVSVALADWAARLGCAAAPAQVGGLLLAHGCPAGRFAAAVRVRGAGGAWPMPVGAGSGAAGAGGAALDATTLDASAVAAAVASGGSWQGRVPADPRQVGPAPGRSFDVYVPPGLEPGHPVPVVLLLHGRGDSGYGMAALTRMNELAARKGFVAVYPEALGDSWNYYLGLPGVVPRGQVDDLAFLKSLVDRLARDLDVDRSRLYVAGFSNGGFMAERAACGISDTFAAFAVVAAGMLPEMVFACDTTPTAPIVLMLGTDDGQVPWSGIVVQQQGRQRYAVLPAAQTLTYWTLRNGCVFLPEQTALPAAAGDPTQVVRVDYAPCALGRDVLVYVVQGGGHNWPGGAAVLPPAEAGNVSTALDASSAIWSFFAAHPLDAGRSRPVAP